MFRATKTFEIEADKDDPAAPISQCRVQLRSCDGDAYDRVCELTMRLGWGLEHTVRYKYWATGDHAYNLLVGAVAHCLISGGNINTVHRRFRARGVTWIEKEKLADAAE